MIDVEPVAAAVGFFHHDDGIGPFRDDGARGDDRGQPRLDFCLRHHPRRELLRA